MKENKESKETKIEELKNEIRKDKLEDENYLKKLEKCISTHKYIAQKVN